MFIKAVGKKKAIDGLIDIQCVIQQLPTAEFEKGQTLSDLLKIKGIADENLLLLRRFYDKIETITEDETDGINKQIK